MVLRVLPYNRWVPVWRQFVLSLSILKIKIITTVILSNYYRFLSGMWFKPHWRIFWSASYCYYCLLILSFLVLLKVSRQGELWTVLMGNLVCFLWLNRGIVTILVLPPERDDLGFGNHALEAENTTSLESDATRSRCRCSYGDPMGGVRRLQ